MMWKAGMGEKVGLNSVFFWAQGTHPKGFLTELGCGLEWKWRQEKSPADFTTFLH